MTEHSLDSGPLLWLNSLESANGGAENPASLLWSEIGRKVKLRELAKNSSAQWPGYVYFPAHSIEQMLLTNRIRVPPEWECMNAQVLSRVVATLAAWNLDRRIYRFTPLAAKVVRNSSVDVPLSIRPFVMMPGFAMYIDLDNVRTVDDSLPYGLFASLNVRAAGTPELVLVLDHRSHMDIKAYPLNGKMPDEIFSEHQKEAPRTEVEKQKIGGKVGLPSLTATYGVDFQILLSSILMTCVNQSTMKEVLSVVETTGRLKLHASVWEVGGKIIENFPDGFLLEHELTDQSVVVVADWSAVDTEDCIELKCSAGSVFSDVLQKIMLGDRA